MNIGNEQGLWEPGQFVNIPRADYLQISPSCPPYEICPKTTKLGNDHNACRVVQLSVDDPPEGAYDRNGNYCNPTEKYAIEVVRCNTCNSYFTKYLEDIKVTWEIDT